MESLLPAKSTAPKSQLVNYKKASGIQIYAKLRKIQINVEYSMSKRYSTVSFYLLGDLRHNGCINAHDWNRLSLLSTITSIIGKRGVFVCCTLKIKELRFWGKKKDVTCQSMYSGENIFNFKNKIKNHNIRWGGLKKMMIM